MAGRTGTSSPAASASTPPAANKGKNKRKDESADAQYYECHFEVVRVLEGRKKGRYSLKVVKPLSSKIDVNVLPTVCLKQERAYDKRAFHIMHNFKHKNILGLKLLAKNESDDPSTVAAYVEPYDGKLWSICELDDCTDDLGHIPSPKFQRYIREIVSGIDFLKKNNLYHGDLTWESTLRAGETVKLAGFKLKDLLMSIEEAQWNDVLFFIKMLVVVSERAHQFNLDIQSQSDPSLPKDEEIFCGTLDSLINKLKKLDRTSLSTIVEIILDDPFFWDIKIRTRFFANTISLKLSDDNFMSEVRSSKILRKSWDKQGTPEFQALLKKMNDFRAVERKKAEQKRLREAEGGGCGGELDKKKWLPYSGNSKEHYVRCVCGGYTHQKQIEMDIDEIIRQNHPSICIDMKNILDAASNLPSGSGSNSSYRK